MKFNCKNESGFNLISVMVFLALATICFTTLLRAFTLSQKGVYRVQAGEQYQELDQTIRQTIAETLKGSLCRPWSEVPSRITVVPGLVLEKTKNIQSEVSEVNKKSIDRCRIQDVGPQPRAYLCFQIKKESKFSGVNDHSFLQYEGAYIESIAEYIDFESNDSLACNQIQGKSLGVQVLYTTYWLSKLGKQVKMNRKSSVFISN